MQWELCFSVSIRYLPLSSASYHVFWMVSASDISSEACERSAILYVACAVTGFFSAFLNTLFFMAALVGLFGNTDYVKNLMGGHNIIIGCCLMVGINAVCEMVSSTVITGAVGAALSKAHLIPSTQISREKAKA